MSLQLTLNTHPPAGNNAMAPAPSLIQTISAASITALTAQVPIRWRIPSPEANHAHVVHAATETIILIKRMKHEDDVALKKLEAEVKDLSAQKIDLEAEKKELQAALKSEKEALAKVAEVEKQEAEKKDTDYQFCVQHLLSYITGEGETRGKIDFGNLRERLEQVGKLMMSIQQLADMVEGKWPSDKEVVEDRNAKNRAIGGGRM